MVKGTCRWVFFIKDYVIKIPSLYSYKNYLNGLLANISEYEFSKCKDFQDNLCPVLFSFPFGFLNIMPKVKVLSQGEFSKECLESYIKNYQIPAEPKFNSFGWYKKRLVAIDYH